MQPLKKRCEKRVPTETAVCENHSTQIDEVYPRIEIANG